MRDAVAVRFIERVGNLDRVGQELIEGQRSSGDTGSQGLSLEKFHDNEVHAILVTYIVDNADMRVIERGYGLRFALESLFEIRPVRDVCRKDFNRDEAVQAWVSCFVHFRHPARARR